MKLNGLILSNFRAFKELHLGFGEQLTLLVGVNGAGKTSILESLAIMLSRLTGRILSTKGTGRFFTDSDIRQGANGIKNSIEILFNQKPISWTVAKTKRGKKQQTLTSLTEIKEVVDQIRNNLEENEKSSIPLVVFYEVNRAVIEVPLRVRTKTQFDQFTAYDHALTGSRNEFRFFFEWYRGREDLENEKRLSLSGEYRDPQLQTVRKAIYALTDFSDLKVKRSPLRMELSKNGQYFDVRQLSDGEKCLLALVGDLARRLAIANPGMEDSLQGEAIVLIDEVDLHLHPEWQHRVVPVLLETFPNCQFVLTTHSPQVLTHVSCKDVRLLVQKEQEVDVVYPEGTYGQDSNFLLKTLMGSSYRPQKVDEKINLLFELIRQDRVKAHDLLNQLQSEVEGDSPDLIRAQTLLHRREVMDK